MVIYGYIIPANVFIPPFVCVVALQVDVNAWSKRGKALMPPHGDLRPAL